MLRPREPFSLLRLLKPIENVNKAFWHWVLGLVWPNQPLTERVDPLTVRRVLLLRYDAIGDMITTLPTIRTLKRLNPDIEVDVMASPKNRRIIEHDPNVTRILQLRNRPDQFIRDIMAARRVGYDVVICCIYAKATKIGIIANWIGGAHAVKATIWRGEKYGRFYNMQSKNAQLEPSMWEKTLRLVPETFGYELQAGDDEPYISIDDASREAARNALEDIGIGSARYIAVNITSNNARNRWPAASFKQLIRAVLEHDRDIRVVVLWMAPDRNVADEIAADTAIDFRGRVAVYPETRDVMEIVAAVERSIAVFSLDTGVVHMASATRRPAMSLYVKRTRAITEWRPYGVTYRAIESDVDDAFVETIPPERVIPLFLDLLDEISDSKTTDTNHRERTNQDSSDK